MPDDDDSPSPPRKKRRTDDLSAGGTVYIEKQLRSGTKRVHLTTQRKRPLRRNKDAIVPPQPDRTSLERKGMTSKDTNMIASLARASREQQIATAAITDWTPNSAFGDTPEFRLRDNNTARCHILADSNVKIIALEIIAKLKEGPTSTSQEEALTEFLNALNTYEAEDIRKALGELATHSSLSKLESVIHRLSHGGENLFFGNNARNEFVLVGFDVPFVDKRPDPRAMRIRDAVIALACHKLIKFMTAMNATSPTYDRRDGLAVSSSAQTRYDPKEVFDSQTPPLKRDWKPSSSDF